MSLVLQLTLSARASAVALHLSRLLRPLWHASCFIGPPVAAAAAAPVAAVAQPQVAFTAWCNLMIIYFSLLLLQRPKLILPRFTAPEMATVVQQLRDLQSFIGAHFPVCIGCCSRDNCELSMLFLCSLCTMIRLGWQCSPTTPACPRSSSSPCPTSRLGTCAYMFCGISIIHY